MSGTFRAVWGSQVGNLRSGPLSAENMPRASGAPRLGTRFKECPRQGADNFFVDESGVSERPTWAPRSETPVIQFHFNWTHDSVIAGLTSMNCLLRFHDSSIEEEQVIVFPKALNARPDASCSSVGTACEHTRAPSHTTGWTRSTVASRGRG